MKCTIVSLVLGIMLTACGPKAQVDVIAVSGSDYAQCTAAMPDAPKTVCGQAAGR